MAMQYLENELRRTGDRRDSKFANAIAKMRRDRRSDILLPLPEPIVYTPPIEVLPLVPEDPIEIKCFSDEQRDVLDENGYIIYDLSGESVNTQKQTRNATYLTREDIGPVTSMCSQVAINPKELFLPDSNNKTLRQQELLVEKFSQGLEKKLRGISVKAIIGEAPDYVELDSKHYDATYYGDGLHLFERDEYISRFARTKTPTGNSSVAQVGWVKSYRSGIEVKHLHAMVGDPYVYAAPLIVPE